MRPYRSAIRRRHLLPALLALGLIPDAMGQTDETTPEAEASAAQIEPKSDDSRKTGAPGPSGEPDEVIVTGKPKPYVYAGDRMLQEAIANTPDVADGAVRDESFAEKPADYHERHADPETMSNDSKSMLLNIIGEDAEPIPDRDGLEVCGADCP